MTRSDETWGARSLARTLLAGLGVAVLMSPTALGCGDRSVPVDAASAVDSGAADNERSRAVQDALVGAAVRRDKTAIGALLSPAVVARHGGAAVDAIIGLVERWGPSVLGTAPSWPEKIADALVLRDTVIAHEVELTWNPTLELRISATGPASVLAIAVRDGDKTLLQLDPEQLSGTVLERKLVPEANAVLVGGNAIAAPEGRYILARSSTAICAVRLEAGGTEYTAHAIDVDEPFAVGPAVRAAMPSAKLADQDLVCGAVRIRWSDPAYLYMGAHKLPTVDLALTSATSSEALPRLEDVVWLSHRWGQLPYDFAAESAELTRQGIR